MRPFRKGQSSLQEYLKQHDQQRKSLYFATTEKAKIRTTKRKALEEIGLWKKKRHSPDPNLVDFDKEGFLQQVNSMKEGEKVRMILFNLSHKINDTKMQ